MASVTGHVPLQGKSFIYFNYFNLLSYFQRREKMFNNILFRKIVSFGITNGLKILETPVKIAIDQNRKKISIFFTTSIV